MPYTRGTKVRFDVTGTQTSNDNVVIGCQTVTLADLVSAASALSKDGSTIRATVEGEADGEGYVSFLSGRRRFTEQQVRERARNLVTEAPAESEWIDGDRIVTGGGDQLVMIGGKWYDLTSFEPYQAEGLSRPQGVKARNRFWDTTRDGRIGQVLIKGGRVAGSAIPGVSRPFAAGDRVRLITDIGGDAGRVGQIGVLEALSSGRTLAFRPIVDGQPATTGGGYGRGLYTITLTGSRPNAEHAPDPVTLPWQEGDEIRMNSGTDVHKRRVLTGGRWRCGCGTSDAQEAADRYLREGSATVVRRGGVAA